VGTQLPELPVTSFAQLLAELPLGEPQPERLAERLWLTYEELRRWSPRAALVGPSSAQDVLWRHYGESLAALPLLRPEDATLVDLGSGAGFPGLVLAAARPRLRVVLVEPRERKWAFLQSAARRASLVVDCLNARVVDELPAGFPQEIDVITVRALRLAPSQMELLRPSLGRQGRLLLWAGTELPEIPPGWSVGAQHSLARSTNRRIVELIPWR
jgi:16S rRNA (guanine527-N7)-methyltransferase